MLSFINRNIMLSLTYMYLCLYMQRVLWCRRFELLYCSEIDCVVTWMWHYTDLSIASKHKQFGKSKSKSKISLVTKGKSSKSIVLAQPSTVTYKDVSIKFSPRHDTKSFLEVLYTNLCQECAIAEALINPDFVVPELPRVSDT